MDTSFVELSHKKWLPSDYRVSGMRGRGSGPEVERQASNSVNSELSELASGSTAGYEGDFGSLVVVVVM